MGRSIGAGVAAAAVGVGEETVRGSAAAESPHLGGRGDGPGIFWTRQGR